MTKYSAQSQALARELAEKAAAGLRRSGHTVVRDSSTGQYKVTRSDNRSPHGSASSQAPDASRWNNNNER